MYYLVIKFWFSSRNFIFFLKKAGLPEDIKNFNCGILNNIGAIYLKGGIIKNG